MQLEISIKVLDTTIIRFDHCFTSPYWREQKNFLKFTAQVFNLYIVLNRTPMAFWGIKGCICVYLIIYIVNLTKMRVFVLIRLILIHIVKKDSKRNDLQWQMSIKTYLYIYCDKLWLGITANNDNKILFCGR